MNKKLVNITSKKIERKITAVTLILGFIITNIILIAGNLYIDEQPHTSITQIKKDSGKDNKIANNQAIMSCPRKQLNY